jgi:hypothetical protein
MKGKIRTTIGIAALAGAIVFLAAVGAQERQAAVYSATGRVSRYKPLKALWKCIWVPPAIFIAITSRSPQGTP